MRFIILGALAIGLVGCANSTCQTKSYAKGDHTRTVCTSAEGLSAYTHTRHGPSTSVRLNVDGDVICTITDHNGNKQTRRIEDAVDFHEAAQNYSAEELEAMCGF